jgi:hypothetical protein
MPLIWEVLVRNEILADSISSRASSILLLCLWAVWASPSARAAEGLLFEREFVSLGRVEASGDLTEEFPFRVAGDRPVQILDVQSSCGCISPTLSKRVYQPGDQDKLIFGIHAASQAEGPKRFQVSISYRQSGDVVTVPILIDVEIYKPITVEPATLLVHVQGDRPFKQQLTIKNQENRPLGAIQLVTSSERIQAKLLPSSSTTTTTRRVEVTISADIAMGKTDERLLLRVEGERPAEIVVPVTLVRASRIKILPEVLHARMVPGKDPSWQVLVSDARGEPIKIDRIEGPSSIIRVSYPKEPTKACRLQVRLSPQIGTEKLDETITVHLTEPVATKLVLPIRVD